MPAGDGVVRELLGQQGRGGPFAGVALAWVLPIFLPAASCQGVKDGIFQAKLNLPSHHCGLGPPPFSSFLVRRRDLGRGASHSFGEDIPPVL